MENEDIITEKEKFGYFGVSALQDREILNVIAEPYLKRNREKTVLAIEEALDRNSQISIETFRMIPGVSENLARALMASLELGRRRTGHKGRQIRTPEDIYQEIRHYASREQEHLIVIALNGAHEVIYTETVTIGLVNLTVVHPREVFSNAILNRASAIAVSHNHPSGCLDPSEEDKAITTRLIKAGRILGINVLDHVIISKDGYMSFREKGLI